MEQSKKRLEIIQAAKLYYYGNMSQEQIGHLMGISRPRVSRLLTEARQLNIVKITVQDPQDSAESAARKLKQRFALKYVEVVPSGNNEEAAKSNVGRAASKFLNEHISDHSKIGISWGTTLAAFTREFQAKSQIPGARVVQLVGGTYIENLNIDGRELVKVLAKKLGCAHSILQAPLVVHNAALRDLLMQEPAVIAHFEHIHSLDMAFVGIGTAYYKDSIAFRANYIEEAESRELGEKRLVCDICGHQLLADGTEPQTFLSNRIVGITLPELHQVPLVVGLCAGHKKAAPLAAALRGRHINAVILDEVSAIALMAAANTL